MIGMKMPVVSASWKASVPIRCVGTWPVITTSGVESRNASATGRDQVRRARARGAHADADLAGRPRVALRHVAGALLVAHEDVPDGVLDARPGVVERQDRAAGDAPADVDALGLEAADDGLGAGHLHRCVERGSGWFGAAGTGFVALIARSPLRRSARRARRRRRTPRWSRCPPRSGVTGPSSRRRMTAGLDGVGGGGLAEVAQHHRGGTGWWRSGWPCRCRRCRARSRGSPRTGPGRPAPSDDDGARPMPPPTEAARSLRMSPNMFSVTITS